MREIYHIPYGVTRTYRDIAQEFDNAHISAGKACGQNPLPVIIPCHRVTGKNSLGGYRYGISVKKKLLDLEATNPNN